MPRVLDRAVRLTLALVVAGGLGFGASTAVAASQSAASCPDDPASGRLPVSCVTYRTCDAPCQDYYGPHSGGGCLNGCCICAI